MTSSVAFTVPPLSSTTISTTGQGEFGTGTAVVSSDIPLGGVIRFDISAPAGSGIGSGIAGVPASPVVSGFVTPVRRILNSINTGVAIRNVGAGEVTLNLSLRGADGVEVASGSVNDTIPGDGQLVSFINTLFPDVFSAAASFVADATSPVANGSDPFVGSLVVTSNGMLAPTSIEQGVNPGEFTTLPVTSLLDGTLSDPGPDPDPDPGPGPGPGPGASSDCLDASLFSTQYSWHAEYVISGTVTVGFVADFVHTPNSSFEGQSAGELFVTSTTDTQIGPVTTEVRTYHQLDGTDILELGSITTLTVPFPGTSTSVNTPPKRDRRFSLGVGESSTVTYTATTTSSFEGLPPVPPFSSVLTETVTYLGRETVTVPAGTFDTCKFDVGDELSTSWLAAGNGFVVKSFTPAGEGLAETTLELQSATFDGSPFTP